VPREEVDYHPNVLLCVVEERRVIRAADDVLLGVRDALVDRLLAGAGRPLIPRRHQVVLLAAEHERGSGDLRQPARDVHVAHGLTGRSEDLDPVGVAQDLLDAVDRGHALRRLEEALGERLPRDQLREDPAAGAVGVQPRDVDPVLEDELSGHAEPSGCTVDHDRSRPFRILAGEDDRDHPAHRGAVDVRLAKIERVEQPGGVVGPDLHVVALHGPVRLPVAAHVVVDDLEVLGEAGRRGSEVEVPEAGAVDLEHRLALARDLVPELDPVHSRLGCHDPSWSSARW
jgi:hypothetical protein